MQLLLKLLFLLHTGVQGVSEVREVIQPELVSVRRGESVTLNCTFIYHATEDAWVHIYWYRTSPGTVDVPHKMNNSQCIPDVRLGGFQRCTVSLKTERISFGHSVYNYTCEVRIPNVYPPLHVKGQGTRMQIYEPPEISILDGDMVAGRESILTCSGKGLYAKNISFTWACPGRKNFTNVTTPTLTKYSNGTSVATSQLKLVPRVEDHGAVCSCQIDHVTFRQPAVKVIKLNVMYGPRDSVITYKLNTMDNYHPVNLNEITVAVQSSLELNCCINSNPTSTVIWTKVGENQNVTLQTDVGLNCSKIWIQFKFEDEGIYWCTAHNDYGWRNTSILINVKSKDHYLLYALVPLPAVIIVAIIYCLICKRQWKDPVIATTELSPENVGRSTNCNTEIDTVYAVVRRKSLPISRQCPTEVAFVNEGNSEEEEVSYADIVIHSPKQLYNQKLKQVPDEKNANKQFKYVCGPPPHHQVDETSEYSAVRVSHQDLRTV